MTLQQHDWLKKGKAGNKAPRTEQSFSTTAPWPISEAAPGLVWSTRGGGTWVVVLVKGVALLSNDLLHEAQGPLKVHVVTHTLGLPTEHGCVAAKARLKLCLGQQVHPQHLHVHSTRSRAFGCIIVIASMSMSVSELEQQLHLKRMSSEGLCLGHQIYPQHPSPSGHTCSCHTLRSEVRIQLQLINLYQSAPGTGESGMQANLNGCQWCIAAHC